MDEGIPETNQHKQSKLSANIENYSAKNYIVVFVHLSFLPHYTLSHIFRILPFSVFLHLLDSYIIKLFDRSVDLAQFNTSTPLYPICRAWMRNNPSVREPASSPSPSHSMIEEEVSPPVIIINYKFYSKYANITKESTKIKPVWL